MPQITVLRKEAHRFEFILGCLFLSVSTGAQELGKTQGHPAPSFSTGVTVEKTEGTLARVCLSLCHRTTGHWQGWAGPSSDPEMLYLFLSILTQVQTHPRLHPPGAEVEEDGQMDGWKDG